MVSGTGDTYSKEKRENGKKGRYRERETDRLIRAWERDRERERSKGGEGR